MPVGGGEGGDVPATRPTAGAARGCGGSEPWKFAGYITSPPGGGASVESAKTLALITPPTHTHACAPRPGRKELGRADCGWIAALGESYYARVGVLYYIILYAYYIRLYEYYVRLYASHLDCFAVERLQHHRVRNHLPFAAAAAATSAHPETGPGGRRRARREGAGGQSHGSLQDTSRPPGGGVSGIR